MKKTITLIAIFVSLVFKFYAQNNAANNQIILEGKYPLSLTKTAKDSIQTISILGSIQGNIQLKMKLRVTDIDGKSYDILIDKWIHHLETELFQTTSGIKKIEVKNLNIRFNEFGETYVISWDCQWKKLNITKGGAPYHYATALAFKNDSFEWFHSQNTIQNNLIVSE